MPDFLNSIDGEWGPSHNGRTFENRDPATGAVLGVFPSSDAEDVAAAAAAAMRARRTWAATPAPRRGDILFRAAELLRARKEALARDVVREMGKVLPEARGDIQEAIDMTYFMAGEGRRLAGQTAPSESPQKWAMSVRAPVGVVGAITPWNFPAAIPAWKIMPALIAGNPVVFKPSQFAPHSAWNLARILAEAGLPPGVLNVLFGDSEDLGKALVGHPDIGVISFTGSNRVGMEVGTRCAQMGKRCSLEMGGKNAIIVLADADLDLALEGILWSAFGTSGQRCTAASRVIVEAAIAGPLTERLVARAQSLRLGSGLDAATDVGPIINAQQLETISGYMQIGRDEGATIACGGTSAAPPGLEGGTWFAPTVFTDARPSMRIAQEEIFGPVTAILRVADLAEAIEVANHVPYGLSTAIYTDNVNRAFAAMQGIETGLVYVNAGTIGAEIQLPFGGTRGTGNGHREAGLAALDVFTEWKTIYVDYSGRLQRAQID